MRSMALVVAAIVVAEVGAVACGRTPSSASPALRTDSPAPSPSASSALGSAPAVTSRFTSALYGYSFALPADWTPTGATQRWDGSGAPTSDDPVVDRFNSTGTAAAFASAATTTMPLEGFVAAGIATNAKVHGDTCPANPDSVGQITVGGETGTLVAWNCGILINVAFSVHDGTGYRFVFRDPGVNAATDATDHATFATMLASVTFK